MFLLGPAGSGKTWRCLTEIREALVQSPDGPPLVLLAPKQATFQLERQLLADAALSGYTRLHILSFERLAQFIFQRLHQTPPPLLNEEGRIMVLRALLARHRKELEVFHASARWPGFAQHLSQLLRELQHHHLSPTRLTNLAHRTGEKTPLGRKLRDFALLLNAYSRWLQEHQLQDADSLLDLATEALQGLGASSDSAAAVFSVEGLWLDGFAEMTPQEIALLAALVLRCQRATLAFCLDHQPAADTSWLSPWTLVGQTYRRCHAALAALSECKVSVAMLERSADCSRFAGQPVLRHLEHHWNSPTPLVAGPGASDAGVQSVVETLRLVQCPTPEDEAIVAAREVLRHVRERGARFRGCAVLLRQLEKHHDVLRRVFTQYGIPFFLDRREPITHHPLAELTRYALRTAAYGWQQEDWFGALKTGLVPIAERDLDLLENEALARGWFGATWSNPLPVPAAANPPHPLEVVRQQIVPSFQQLCARLAQLDNGPTGVQLADALRRLWGDLNVETQLATWTETAPAAGPHHPAMHATVWEQMNEWATNLARAFPSERLPLRDWLPIVEAGLAGLTVGVIPPALDQVLIGAIDRSRNPELQLAVILGVNESLFPAPPTTDGLLTEVERLALEREDVWLGPTTKQRLGHERYFGYIACTRARQRLVLTCATRDAQDRALNPSRFVQHLQQLFPGLALETFSPAIDWRECEHVTELLPWLVAPQADASSPAIPAEVGAWPCVAPMLERLRLLHEPSPEERLSAPMVDRLYGQALQTSVTHLERFAECPFRFFVHTGLRAQERERFEADVRQMGSYQHAVLKEYHDRAVQEGRQWRDFTSAEARTRLRKMAQELAKTFADGVMLATEQSRFLTQTLTANLEDFIETTTTWLRAQYAFNPTAAELEFGPKGPLPPWELPLANDRQLKFIGVIDRVDLWTSPEDDAALCVVMDYKSSARRVDPRLLANGVQLQLPAYLSVLRHLKDPQSAFGVQRLIPAGVFYVNLRGQYDSGKHRNEVLADVQARPLAFQHSGRFNQDALEYLDTRPRPPDQEKFGDQFHFRITKKGKVHGAYKDAMNPNQFGGMLDQVETLLRDMGERIFQGEAGVSPYRQSASTPCQRCDYRAICRFDPWTQSYRALNEPQPFAEEEPEMSGNGRNVKQ